MIDPIAATGIATAAIALISSVVVPAWLRRRDRAEKRVEGDAITMRDVNLSLRRDKEELQKRLDEIESRHLRQLDEADARHRAEMKAFEAEWEQRIAVLRGRVTELESENAGFRVALRALGQAP